MKKDFQLGLVIIIFLLFFFVFPVNASSKNDFEIWSKTLINKKDIKILPTSYFYFLKELSRNLSIFLVFNSEKKT